MSAWVRMHTYTVSLPDAGAGPELVKDHYAVLTPELSLLHKLMNKPFSEAPRAKTPQLVFLSVTWHCWKYVATMCPYLEQTEGVTVV